MYESSTIPTGAYEKRNQRFTKFNIQILGQIFSVTTNFHCIFKFYLVVIVEGSLRCDEYFVELCFLFSVGHQYLETFSVVKNQEPYRLHSSDFTTKMICLPLYTYVVLAVLLSCVPLCVQKIARKSCCCRRKDECKEKNGGPTCT